MTPVVLWTDALIFLLLAAGLTLGVYVRRTPHLRAQWQRAISRRLGSAALVVLVFYVLVGLLDSLHFRVTYHRSAGDEAYTGEVLSLLDWIVTPLRTQEERTYSAPFATRLYAGATSELPDGLQTRSYPRLTHGGAHLDKNGSGYWQDILQRGGAGVFKGALIWMLLGALIVWYQGRKNHIGLKTSLHRIIAAQLELPWHTMLLTVGSLLVLAGAAAELSVKYHILGTDKVGQDVFYQSLKSIRTGLAIGTLTTLVMLPFAVFLGIAAGYFRGWIDDVIQYLYTTLNSIPGILLIAAAILSLQVYMSNQPELFDSVEKRADMRLLFLCLILGMTSWTGLCRLLRGESLKLRELDYVQAATAFGVSHFRIITRHLLPNVMHIVLIAVVIDFSGLVLAEAVLSYVEIGVDPTMHSWGNMINSARLEMARDPMVWWSLLAAFLFMFVLVLAANLFADAVRDAFDPRSRARTI